MATGDVKEITGRLKALLPAGWFSDTSPILNAILNGIASALASIFSLAGYARLQTRIATATDGFLDLVSFDFFGNSLPRNFQESDAAFRLRIQSELLLERGTRKGLIRALQILTGRTPWVFEPARPADTGAYGTNSLGYGVAGGYGSLQLHHQAFVVAYRPLTSGIPNIAGYGISTGAYNTASQSEYANLSMVQGAIPDAAIDNAISAVIPAGTIAWTRISN